jgi:cyclopropane fatty-acyl-phospholipid synthase-like methyltransferase
VSDRETIDIYNQKAGEYAGLTDDANDADPRLAAFITACPKGGHVLDFGCGPGASAALMAKAGLQVSATDASQEMIAMAERHDGVSATQATFADLNESGIYDGVWANFSLLHAPRKDMPEYLSAIHKSLKPQGAFFIALKTGEGEKRDRIGRFYTYYSREELDGLLINAGFTLLNHEIGSSAGLDGSVADWISVATHA